LDPALPSLTEVIGTLIGATWRELDEDDYVGAVRRIVAAGTFDALRRLSVSEIASVEARAVAWTALEGLRTHSALQGDDFFAVYQSAVLDAFLDNPERYPPAAPQTIPDGSPIGGEGCGVGSALQD
jgi:autonomous glycyl radical cofactor GrcA